MTELLYTLFVQLITQETDILLLRKVTVQNVLSVTIFSVIIIISAMKWSCCLDKQLNKSVIACHLICYRR